MAAVLELVGPFHDAIPTLKDFPDLDLFALHLNSESKAKAMHLVLDLLFHV